MSILISMCEDKPHKRESSFVMRHAYHIAWRYISRGALKYAVDEDASALNPHNT